MTPEIPLIVLCVSIALLLYTYLGYPLTLWLVGRTVPKPKSPDPVEEWPRVSFSVPAYNEESQIEGLILSLLALDYPADRRQILIVSDASSDRTDEIVRGFADQGVELLRMSERGGKTKAERAAAAKLTGEIVVNTDASIRIAPDALKPLIAVFSDPSIGCASGRDVSVGPDETASNSGESGYVGYEMAIRDLETRVSGIVGASGCFYAIRAELHRLPLPESLSRDFASALHTKEQGYRAVSVAEAVCRVPRTTSLHKEYRRKVRTITRGMQTLWYKRRLLNPFRSGVFAWMLFSHKVCRWALPWAFAASCVSLAALAPSYLIARLLLGAVIAVLALAWLGWRRAAHGSVPKLIALPAYVVAGNLAAAHAFVRAVRGTDDSLWEPTRREAVRAS